LICNLDLVIFFFWFSAGSECDSWCVGSIYAVGDLRFVLYIYIFVLFEGHVNSILQHQIMQRTHYLVIPAHEHTRQLKRLKKKKKN
jgi:hypothetical protein